jgi:hypothetical protein
MGRGSGYCMLLGKSSPTSTLVDKTLHEAWTSKNPLLNISNFLVVMLMCMFQRKIGVSWITKLKNVSLLVIKMV